MRICTDVVTLCLTSSIHNDLVLLLNKIECKTLTDGYVRKFFLQICHCTTNIHLQNLHVWPFFPIFFNIIFFVTYTMFSEIFKNVFKSYSHSNVLVLKVALSISCFCNFDLTCLISHPHWIIDLWCPKGRYHLWNLNLLFKKRNIKTVARKLATRCFVQWQM